MHVILVIMKNVEDFSDEEFVPKKVLALANKASIECIPMKPKAAYERGFQMFHAGKKRMPFQQ